MPVRSAGGETWDHLLRRRRERRSVEDLDECEAPRSRSIGTTPRGQGRGLSAALLAGVTVAYVVLAEPFGEIINIGGLPKNGDFRVRAELHDSPTAMVVVGPPKDNIAFHLIDSGGREVFVGFVRKGKVAELRVPEGRWRAVLSAGDKDSLHQMADLRDAQPIGQLAIRSGEIVSLKPAAQAAKH